MAQTTLSLKQLISSDFSEGSSFVVNKGANGSTASAVLLFNPFGKPAMVTKIRTNINSVKVGGNNILTENINIKFEWGYYSNSTFTSYGWSATESASEGSTTQVAKDITPSGVSYVSYGVNDTPAVRITISSANSGRGCKVTLSNFTLTADYTLPTYTITTAASPTEAGTVTQTGSGYYEYGGTAGLTATPNKGWVFKQWNDGNTDNPRAVTVTGNATYTAIFQRSPYVVYGQTTAAGGGKVTAPELDLISGGANYGYFNYGDEVTLTATPDEGYFFKEWQDGNTDNPRTVTVTEAAVYSATFEKGCQITLVVDTEDGTITGANHGDYYKKGSTLTVTATANPGYKFQCWYIQVGGGGYIYPEDNPYTLTLTEDTLILAAFEDAPPEFLSAQLIYGDQQVSQSNKVKAGEGFRIIIDVQ